MEVEVSLTADKVIRTRVDRIRGEIEEDNEIINMIKTLGFKFGDEFKLRIIK